jgi:DNA-binding NarL/FixJ family response regulator
MRKAIDLGAVACLPKPLDSEVLLAHISAAISG